MFAEQLARHAKMCLCFPTHYLWGGIGEYITPELIACKAALYPSVYTSEYQQQLLRFSNKNIRGFDCSGLINNFRMGGLCHFCFAQELDQNSQSLFDNANVKDNIQSVPELCGICLYLKGHVGIYIGCGNVIEATSNPKFGNGVVKTKLSDREWTHWFCCPGIKY